MDIDELVSGNSPTITFNYKRNIISQNNSSIHQYGDLRVLRDKYQRPDLDNILLHLNYISGEIINNFIQIMLTN